MIKSVNKEGTKISVESTEGLFHKDFGASIIGIEVFKNRILVCLGTKNQYENRNFFCLNERAEVLWQIQDPDTYRPGKQKSGSPFTGIHIHNDILEAVNWNSHSYEVDIESGRLTNAHYHK